MKKLIPAGVIPFLLFLLACGGKSANEQQKADLKKYLGYEYADTENSLLWEISGNGLEQPSFLYGSIHIQRKEVFGFDSLIYKILDTVEAYAMEVNMEEVNPFKSATMMMMDKPLDEIIPMWKYMSLDSIFIAKTGSGIGLMKTTKPFFLMALLMKEDIGTDLKEPLDLHFFNYAKKKKKKLIGVEKFEEQIAAVDELTIEEQVDMIIYGMRDTTSSFNNFDDLMKTYLEQDINKMLELTKDTTFPEKFNKAFLTDRNVRMADRIGEIVKEQVTFIAIGAAHLGGPEGVIELLRKKGYTVKPIKLNFK